MTTSTCVNGVAAASALAGPVTVTPLMVAGWSARPSLSLAGIGQTIAFLLAATIVGLFLSVFPNAIGAATLAWLGRDRAWARRPTVWAMAGAVFGWLLQIAFGGTEGVPALAVTGMVCALICRWGTRWHD